MTHLRMSVMPYSEYSLHLPRHIVCYENVRKFCLLYTMSVVQIVKTLKSLHKMKTAKIRNIVYMRLLLCR